MPYLSSLAVLETEFLAVVQFIIGAAILFAILYLVYKMLKQRLVEEKRPAKK